MGRWMFLSGADFQTPCFTRMLFRLEDLIKKALQRAYGDSHPNFIPIELSPWRHSFIMIMGLLVSSFAACLRLLSSILRLFTLRAKYRLRLF